MKTSQWTTFQKEQCRDWTSPVWLKNTTKLTTGRKCWSCRYFFVVKVKEYIVLHNISSLTDTGLSSAGLGPWTWHWKQQPAGAAAAWSAPSSTSWFRDQGRASASGGTSPHSPTTTFCWSSESEASWRPHQRRPHRREVKIARLRPVRWRICLEEEPGGWRRPGLVELARRASADASTTDDGQLEQLHVGGEGGGGVALLAVSAKPQVPCRHH